MEIPKVRKDDLGRTIWFGPASAGKFDLVSENDLESTLDAGDAVTRKAITDLANAADEGVLAKNSEIKVITGWQINDPFAANVPLLEAIGQNVVMMFFTKSIQFLEFRRLGIQHGPTAGLENIRE